MKELMKKETRKHEEKIVEEIKGTESDRHIFIQGVFFYLWTDPDKINTAFVKLKENYLLFLRIFFIFDRYIF